MPSIKEYDNKLHSLKNTSKMTRTMKMVSASKLRRAQDAQKQSSIYAARLNEFIARLAASADVHLHPLLQPRDQEKKVLLLVYTSDKGLCGGFNNNLTRMVSRWMDRFQHKYEQIGLSFCGRRGYSALRNKGTLVDNFEETTASPEFDDAHRIGERLTELYASGEYDSVYLVYNQFKSALSQTPTMMKILPFESTEFLEGGEQIPSDYIFEPEQIVLLERLLPRTLYFKIYYALLENSAGEHGARMTAMDNATTNAKNMIESYTLRRNRARQAAITTELIEIVAGAEAL